MNFGLIIIGDEILSGKRADKHLAKTIALLGARGLQLAGPPAGDAQPRPAAKPQRYRSQPRRNGKMHLLRATNQRGEN